MVDRLHRALIEQKKSTKQTELEIYGTLGIPLGGQRLVEVPGRASYVYVKLRDNQNEVIQAWNNTVATSYGLPVIVQRDGNRYIVLGVNTERYQSNWNVTAPYLPQHASSHSFVDGGGGDVVWVQSRQFIPGLVYPQKQATGTFLTIAPYTLFDDGSWKYVGGTGTPNLMNYRPTGSNAVMALVYLDANTGNPGILVGSGSYFNNNITGSRNIYEYIPVPDLSYQIPLSAVRLDSGTYGIGWNNLYDVRQWLHTLSVSTSTGSSGVDTHNLLLGIQGGNTNERYHLTSGQYLGLIGNQETTLHSHPTLSHAHATARWVLTSGTDTFDYPNVVDVIESVSINGLGEDSLLYSLSANRTQLIFSNPVNTGSVVQSNYLIAQA